MGGVGSGGGRPRAGRPWTCACGVKNPPREESCQSCGKLRAAAALRPGRVLVYPAAPATAPGVAPVDVEGLDESQAPNDLTTEERLVWMEMAGLAMSRGRLLKDVQAYPFQLLCKNIALERRYSRSVMDAGSANHRGMIQVIDRELLRFGLIDIGKVVPVRQPAVNPFAAFGGAAK